MPSRGMIGIIDHGMGNIQSVLNAFERLGETARLATTPEDLATCDGIVLPGVGSFGHAMKNLHQMGIVETLLRMVRSGCPLLGICLGMQLLADESEEHGIHEGLGLIPGKVRLIPVPPGVRLPHIGWNTVAPTRTPSLFDKVTPESAFYFVHSYRFECDPEYVAAVTDYGVEISAAVQRGTIFGVQFHPEKSQASGRRLLKNFAACVAGSRMREDHA